MAPLQSLKSYPLTGDQFRVLTAYRDEIFAYQEDYDKIMKDAETAVQEMTARRRDTMQRLWIRMAEAVGLDAQETWDSPDYSAEFHYVDDGFGAIIHVPPRRHPLAEIMKEIDPEGEPGAEPVVPEGQVLN